MSHDIAFVPLACPREPGPWIFAEEGRRWLEAEALPRWLLTRRWFGGKGSAIAAAGIEQIVPVTSAHAIFVVRVRDESGGVERYAVPLGFGEIEDGVLARRGGRTLHDAVFAAEFRAALLVAMRERAGGAIAGEGSALLDACGATGESRVLGVEQSNTSVIYGGRLFLKLFRRLHEGMNPDAEISRFLGEAGFEHSPPFAGALELRGSGASMPLGLLLGLVENDGDAWSWALARVGEHYASGAPVPGERIALLGQRTAELHLALARGATPAFAPEPLTRDDFAGLAASVRTRLDRVCGALERAGDELALAALRREASARAMVEALARMPPAAVKMRHHGDYHLGQVLASGGDWKIIDFEGEPLRPLAERRAKRSPLRDVAGMLRSFHYAAHAARPETAPLESAEAWSGAASAAFLERYLAVAQGAPFLPGAAAERDAMIAAFVLEKVLYEIDYELNNRPAWVGIPLRGFLAVTAR